MPTYEYSCENCGYIFEEYQSMKEAPLLKCPNCGQNKLQKHIGAGSGVIFKGSGFYVTDYKKKNSTSSKSTSSKKEKQESGDITETKDTKDTRETKDKQTKDTKESKPKEKSKNKKEDKK